MGNATVKEWLIDEGYCYAGFVAGKADCVIYGAAAGADEGDKWELVYAEPQEREIAISDEETKKVQVDETNILWEIISDGNKGKYENGIWFGGVEGQNVTDIFCSRPGGGCCIACSGQSVVVGFNDKKKGQEGGNCQKAVLNMVGYLFTTEG